MFYIQKEPTEIGAFPPPQSLEAEGLYKFPEEFIEEFISYNGFVFLTVEGEAVTAISPNIEAWEAWKATLPKEEKTPKAETSTVYDELAAAYKEGVQEA